MTDQPQPGEDQKEEPGRYESKIEGFPGYFRLPYPFLERHFYVWWDASIASMKGKDPTSHERFLAEWKGARELIKQFGEWGIEGIPVGDLDSDSLPMEVISWVMTATDDYIAPLLPPRKLLGLQGISSRTTSMFHPGP